MNAKREAKDPDASTYAENASFWIKIIRERLDPYRNELTDDAVVGAVGDGAGLRVLDVGCGEGYLSRRLAENGAAVTGIDTCVELIDAAIDAAAAQSLTTDHRLASADALPFDDESFDVVVGNHVLNDLPDLDGPLHEFARVLRAKGRLVVLMLHPCFYQPRADRGSNSAPLDVGEYFAGRRIEQHFSVAGLRSPAPVRAHVRSLEAISSALERAGFVIAGLREPHPGPQLLASNPWWGQNFSRPLFLLLVAVRSTC